MKSHTFPIGIENPTVNNSIRERKVKKGRKAMVEIFLRLKTLQVFIALSFISMRSDLWFI